MNNQHYLQQALQQASINRGFCSPNPAVGAVIVNQAGQVIAQGTHRGPGTPHAEVDAIRQLSTIPPSATIYVTLEPCCHFGRTPPCTNAIIEAGIKKVIYGYKDPNPIVAGKGEKILHEAGVECELYQTPEIDAFYESYAYWHHTKKPWVTAKLAMTLDGKIAGAAGQPIKITGDETNQFTHQQRKLHDAILTTAKTILADDPQLNARIGETTIAKPIYILDRELRLPLDSRILTTAHSITVFYAASTNTSSLEALQKAGVKCIAVRTVDSRLDLAEVVSAIGTDGVHDLWIEAGGACFAAFHQAKLLNKSLIYIALHTQMNGQHAFTSQMDFREAKKITYKQIGNDNLCEMRW